MSDETGDPTATPWREVLLQRLLVATTPVIVAAVLMAVFATRGRNQLVLCALLPFVPLQLAAVFARRWSFTLRAGVLVAPLVLGAHLTYALIGFMGNGSLVAAAAVVVSSLLFGRRGALVVLGLVLLAPLLSGAAMLTGVLESHQLLDFALDQPRPWIRTTFVSLSVWTVLGLAVTFVVQRIETALSKARDALEALRQEAAHRERAEKARREAQESAMQAQKLEIVGRLSAGVAHDFNNLLGVVGAWSELMSDGTASAEDRRLAREALDTVVTRGGSLTHQLLALARQDQRVVTRVYLEGAVKSGVMALQRMLPAGVRLSFAQGSGSFIEADAAEVQQILFNLVLNARDAMPAGGSIHVMTDVSTFDTPLRAVGGSLAAGRWASLSVTDTGPGIGPAIRDSIFELFFTTKPPGQGTGLGLATVLRIAKAGGGGVALQTELGRGSTFTVYWPPA